ncbi:hypothetical protein GCM10022245_37720 [Streptomyces mayteni]
MWPSPPGTAAPPAWGNKAPCLGMRGTVTDMAADPGDDEPTEGGQSGGCGDGDGCGRQ